MATGGYIMPDKLLSATKCDRCGGPLKGGRVLSDFTGEALCLSCKREERMHPDYQKAVDAAQAALNRGDFDFPGIGWPGKNGRVK